MSKVRLLIINALIAALYTAISLTFAPLSFGGIQFRIPEMFNHLIVFSPSYFPGIVLGVFFTNLQSPLGWYDLVFGVLHSVTALLIVIFIGKFLVTSVKVLLVINVLIFTITMNIIAFELYLALELPFWLTYATTAFGELVVMAVGVPIFYMLNKKLLFKDLIDR